MSRGLRGGRFTQANSVAAAGTNQATAKVVSQLPVEVTGADGTKGIVLPLPSLGEFGMVYNAVATLGLKIYPPTGCTINGGTPNASITIEGKTVATFFGTSTTNWGVQFTPDT